ncbi:uncharacterized protein [Rutidosis leptorrhynchoides]|uniref:uncharacterized protein n=1 Tax=Rutidosis leptorrhynchoides TaxID=125765 RepID=UPI003A9927DE
MTGGQSASSSTTIDISSLYFLTPSDNPGQNFVGDNLLRDGNYSDRKNKMMNALFAKNKFGFLDGSIPTPAEGSNDFMNWRRCNAMVRGWLVNSMEKEIKMSVKYAITARDIWTDLQERFDKENAPRAYELRRSVSMIHQDNQTISAYYTKLRTIWDEIASVSPIPTCTCNACTCELSKSIGKMRDKERLYNFLMGLNDEYNGIRSQILSSDPLPSVMAAFHLVNQDEQQRIIVRIGTGDEQERGDDKICTYCQKTGHTIDGCFEIVGYPDWWTKKAAGSKNQTNRFKDQPKTAAVHDDKQTTNLSREDIEHLLQLKKVSKAKDTKPIANTTGLTFEEPDWDG